MKNILKQFEVSDIDLKTSRKLPNTNLKLTLVYSTVIIFVIIVLNISTYLIFNQRLSINIVDQIHNIENEDEEYTREDEISKIASEELLEVMLLIDAMLFILVIILSYFLSSQALRPLNKSYLEQKRFLGDVAHELRTPLTVMRTGLESYIISNKDSDNKKINQSIEEIDHMSNILNDLTFLIKNETFKETKKEKINFSEIVKSEIEKISHYAKDKNIQIEQNIDEKENLIVGNETQIRQLVKNLLKNSIDYNKSNGRVYVSLKLIGVNTNLQIKDTGVGIKDEDLSKIFDRFFKVSESRSKDSSSTGLGLAIVKTIVSNHEGKISVESALGAGTTFNITFKTA
ncbi:MAG: hypothetical protein QG654_295 [Patescibacteria group bacterium]|nr:hypothetical protein [Patescibacteria group bacterium]